MGGLIAYALTKKIERTSIFKPDFLIISATLPPFYYRKEKIHKYLDEELIQVIRNYNVTPKEVLDSKELMELLLPTIRADYKLIETYTPERAPTLKSKVILFNSEQDIEKERMIQWQSYFMMNCDYKIFKGNHFFLTSRQEDIIVNINNIYYSHTQ
jgi:surfactin synthase thioesterase subunit